MGKGKLYYLSPMDGGVPTKDYFKIYQIIHAPNIGVSQLDIKTWRKKSFHAAKKQMEKNNYNDFEKFWNYNVCDFDSNINFFARSKKLAPIAHLIRCFGEVKRESLKEDKILISFGIYKDHLRDYAQKNIIHKNPFSKDDLVPPAEEIHFIAEGSDVKVDIKKNQLYYMWVHWCELNKLSKTEAIMQAMREQIESHKVEGLLDITKYGKASYVYITDNTRADLKKRRIFVELEEDVYKMLTRTVRNYNADPNHLGKPGGNLTYSKLFNNLAKRFLSEIGLKYKAPDLYKEYELLMQEEQYFKNIIMKNGAI